MDVPRLSEGQLLELRRWNTPSLYNGWEQVTRHDSGRDAFNLEEVHDFMPHLGPMVGYALTMVIEPSQSAHKHRRRQACREYYRYLASQPGPKIVVMQDLDKPRVIGSFWGEVTSSTHRALGCVGTIVDGAIRDVEDMTKAGFKALARRLCVGHAYSTPVRWGEPVEVFGRLVQPGQLIHADQHGFLAIPAEDEAALLEAVRFMDSLECSTVIAAARSEAGLDSQALLEQVEAAQEAFRQAVRGKFSG